jgi:hypothetical protein
MRITIEVDAYTLILLVLYILALSATRRLPSCSGYFCV